MPALIVFDTNVVMDIWLGRDGDDAVLLLTLAEQRRIELVVPEFVLIEFRGTARRWVRDQRARLADNVRTRAHEWGRSNKLDDGADNIRTGANKVEAALGALECNIEPVVARLSALAKVVAHSAELHFRGDLRYLRGDPPDRPIDGLKDCRIYEAIFDILRADEGSSRVARILVTKDRDFARYAPIVGELAGLGATLRADPGNLYRELLAGEASAPS
jgi:predicted nucleic acid-binding protein